MTDSTVKKPSVWARFLLIWALVLLILGGVGCYLLYRYLGVYEVTRPEPVMDEFIANTEIDDLVRLSKENVQLELTEFEDPLELFPPILTQLICPVRSTIASIPRRAVPTTLYMMFDPAQI